MNISTTLKINLPSITIYKILEFYINGIIQYTLLGGPVSFMQLNYFDSYAYYCVYQ